MADNARGFERLAIELERHVKGYVPKKWAEPISNVACSPFILADDARMLMRAERGHSLEAALVEMGKKFSPWYVQEAVQDFFNKRMYAAYEEELKI